MKNLLYIPVLLVFTINSFSQSPIIPMNSYDYTQYIENCYVKDIENELDFWEGTWQYTNGDTSFTIIIEKVEMYYHQCSPDGKKYYIDKLFGGYQYIENNTLVTDQMTYNTGAFYPFTNPLSGGANENRAQLWFNDPIDNSEGIVYLELLPGSTTQAQWRLTRIEPYDDNYSVPNSVILTKIN